MRTLAFLLAVVAMGSLTAGQSVSKPEQPTQQPAKTQPKMADQVDQHDTTDIFAIPFDTSEEEEDQEIKSLDNLSKKLQAEKQKKQQQK